ncbi:MAG: radical SAM protein [Thermodesulfobacteriota bacterium]
MKISLVFPPFHMESLYNLPPLGLVNLATMVYRPDRPVQIHDMVLALRRKEIRMGETIYDDCAEMILEKDPDMVGFSAQCTTYPAVVQIARRVKARRKGLRIVVGGHNASFVDERTLGAFPWIDAVIRGEGEITFRELVEAWEADRDLGGVAGLTYRSGSQIVRNPNRELIGDLDILPLPDYSLLPAFSVYRDACGIPRSIAILEVGRGCPHRCVYCSESRLWRRRTRTFSADRLVREMGSLHAQYGAECFLLAYDQFTSDRAFVEDFCHRVITSRLNHLPWYCISRLDTVDAPLLRLMREAGCESMCYGIDSGSKRTLAFIRKRIDKSILYQRVRETTDQGMVPTLSFVIGFPEEERRDIDETLRLALKTGIQGNSNPLIQLPTVLPGTELCEKYADRLVREVDTYFSLGLEFREGRRLPSDEELIQGDPLLFSSFYNVPCRGMPLAELHLLAGYFPLIVNFFPKSFLLLSLATGRSVSVLFLEWLEWVRSREGRQDLFLAPRDCYEHFTGFAEEALRQREVKGWSHIREILRYEQAALEVGKFPERGRAGNIDLCRLQGWRPLCPRNVLIGGFEKNVPGIVEDMKTGLFREDYPRDETWLVFRQDGNRLEVTEINDFGRDFLGLCDGDSTVEEIAERLFRRYGADMEYSDFVGNCREALVGLWNMNLLREAPPEVQPERR